MSDVPDPEHSSSDAPSLQQRIDQALDRFEEAWKAAGPAGPRPRIEDYLGAVPEPDRPLLFRELLVLEISFLRRAGEPVRLGDYQRRLTQSAERLEPRGDPRPQALTPGGR